MRYSHYFLYTGINQKNRRNLSTWELGKHALMFEPLFKEQAKERQVLGGELKGKLQPMLAEATEKGETRDKIAEIAGISHGTMDKVKAINATAAPELKQKLDNQEISINQAYQQIKT